MMRPSWDEYFIEMTKGVSTRATCDRGKNGCVIVKDKRILSTGYVGSPPGLPHCDEAGHLMRKVIDDEENISQHCVRTIHAEHNAILQAARFGISLEGTTLYVKMTPCRNCAMAIISSGVKRVVAEKRYHKDQESIQMFKEAGIELTVLKDEVEEYKNQ